MSASIMGKSQTVNHSIGAKPIWVRLLIIFSALLAAGIVAFAVVLPLDLVSLPLAMTAWIVCVISSLVAHVVGEYPSGKDNFAARLALSISTRTGPPLLAVVFVKIMPTLDFQTGFVLLTIMFYLVGLIVDVALHVSRLKPVE